MTLYLQTWKGYKHRVNLAKCNSHITQGNPNSWAWAASLCYRLGVSTDCHIGRLARIRFLDTEVDSSNTGNSMLCPSARDFIRIASVDSAVKWVPGGDNLVKDVQCYELLGWIALKNHAFSFSFFFASYKRWRWNSASRLMWSSDPMGKWMRLYLVHTHKRFLWLLLEKWDKAITRGYQISDRTKLERLNIWCN